MTDSENVAAAQPVASEKPVSAVADAEITSDTASEKKPRRPRRRNPAGETLAGAEPQTVQTAQTALTEHPVQAPAVAAAVLPAHTAPAAVPAVSESAVPAVVSAPDSVETVPSTEAAEGESTSKRRRSRRSGRGRRRPDGAPDAVAEGQTVPAEAEAAPAGESAESGEVAATAATSGMGETGETGNNEAPRKSRSRSRRRKPAARPEGEGTPEELAEDRVFVFDDDDDEAVAEPASAESGEAGEAGEEEPRAPRVPRKPRRRRNRKSVEEEAAEDDIVEDEDDEEAPKKGRKPAKPAASSVDRKMLVSVLPGDMVEVVLTEDGVVREYYVEMTHQAKIRGNIYKGVINNIDTNLQAAFVNYGNVKNGFLQIDEVHPEYYLQPHEAAKGRKYPPIQKVLKPGQEVLVQVVKEPNGSKGAFLTTWVSLAGRFLVLTPGQEQIGISRKVEDGEERNRLRELIRGLEPGEGLGAIVRTVSAGTSKTTLQKDLSFLKRVWKDIRKRATTEKVPSLIYQEPGLASRSVRDYLSDDVAEVWVDDADTAEAIREMATLLFPRKADLVHLYEGHDKTLWERFGLLNQIEQVHSREVIMPSGGRLVFDQTEALMAIDINSGKIGGKTNFESMAFRTNMEAASGIARQLRLRDIGGQIVIDFIEMRDPDHCREVEKELRNAMKGDRARHDIGKMSSFGLLQIVRQRTGSSAISISMEACPHCKGTGQRRNMEWQAVQALRDLTRALRGAAAAGQTEYAHTVDAELGLYLLNHKRERLALLEKESHVRLDIRIEGISSAQGLSQNPQGGHGQSNAR